MSLDKPKSKKRNASEYKFGIAASRFNGKLVDALIKDVRATLMSNGAKEKNIRLVRVPGAAELPYTASLLAQLDFDAVICLGVVIAGDTPHHIVIADSTAAQLQKIAVDSCMPMINGIIVTNNREQAEARTLGDIRRGVEFAESAIEMAKLGGDLMKEVNEFNHKLKSLLQDMDDEDEDGGWTIDDDDDFDETELIEDFDDEDFDDDNDIDVKKN